VTFKPHNRPSKRSRIPVRVGGLERTLDNFNRELAQKTAMTMAEYDHGYVAPLRARVAWLERSLWARFWYRLSAKIRPAKPLPRTGPAAPTAIPETSVGVPPS
jgi:hypothetical protein